MTTYENLKKLISMKEMTEEEKQKLVSKMDMFLIFNRISQEEYETLYKTLYPDEVIEEVQENQEENQEIIEVL